MEYLDCCNKEKRKPLQEVGKGSFLLKRVRELHHHERISSMKDGDIWKESLCSPVVGLIQVDFAR